MSPQEPSREVEKNFLAELPPGSRLAGVDEVGRGAIAGPVCVGIAVIDNETSDDFPAGLRDSKLLSARAREKLYLPCQQWPVAVVVGSASASVVDRIGIIAALRFAAADATRQLFERGITFDAVLLDGNSDWWSSDTLFDRPEEVPPSLPVRTMVKADAHCAVVSAASVVAKVTRDREMLRLSEDYPAYDWASNKGYSSARHNEALASFGATSLHRRSWNLPGLGARGGDKL